LREDLNQKRQLFDDKFQRQHQIMQKYSPENLVRQLDGAAQEVEQQSDAIADSFLEGTISHQEFLKSYTEKRKLFHLRSAKKETLLISR